MINLNIKEEDYTASQKVALAKLEAFIKKPTGHGLDRVFLLKGKAGTGKTTIIRHAFLKQIERDQENIDVDSINADMFSTPNVIGITMAHKAKKVLSQSIHVCATFASCFGLKMVYNDDGSVSFERAKKRHDAEKLMCDIPVIAFVHDECSMYDQTMLDIVLKFTHPASKIIFMGDRGQLPPVNAKTANGMPVEPDQDSPIFSLPLREENMHELTERVRQTKDNPILEMSDIIYDEIFGSQNLHRVFDAFKSDKLIDGKGFMTISYAHFLDHFKAISEDYTDTKVVAYKNVRVDAFNDSIRRHIYNNPSMPFIENELISMNDTFMKTIKISSTKMKLKWICYNSDEYKIKEIMESKIDELDVYNLYVETEGHRHLKSDDNPYVPVVMPQALPHYNKLKADLSYYARTAATDTRAMKWKKFYDFDGQFAKISYAYCFTGYKVQGSGYKNVYIDVNDIVTTKAITNKRKLQALYTAVTRGIELVIFLKSNGTPAPAPPTVTGN